MTLFSLALALALAAPGQARSGSDVKSFLDLLDSLQPQVEDFRCEYEGTNTFKNREGIELHHLKEDGLYETFSGVFTWKANGDTVYDAFRRQEPEGKLTRETMIVTGKQAEHYLRLEDSPMGGAVVDDADFTNPDRSSSFGHIFLIDSMKRHHASMRFDATLEESDLDGRPCSILTFRQKETGRLFQRYFVDLKKGGLVFRRESFRGVDQVSGRTTIEFASFPVGKSSAWMPVAGLVESFSRMGADKKRVISKDPIGVEKIYVVDGTLEFNRHPPPSTFSAKYKPGTPVADRLKRLQSEFGQLKPHTATRSEAETQLREQLALAEAQKTELVAGSPARSPDWSSTFAWIFGACALAASLAVVLSRRR